MARIKRLIRIWPNSKTDHREMMAYKISLKFEFENCHETKAFAISLFDSIV